LKFDRKFARLAAAGNRERVMGKGLDARRLALDRLGY
jgi:hypothetical protein